VRKLDATHRFTYNDGLNRVYDHATAGDVTVGRHRVTNVHLQDAAPTLLGDATRIDVEAGGGPGPDGSCEYDFVAKIGNRSVAGRGRPRVRVSLGPERAPLPGCAYYQVGGAMKPRKLLVEHHVKVDSGYAGFAHTLSRTVRKAKPSARLAETSAGFAADSGISAVWETNHSALAVRVRSATVLGGTRIRRALVSIYTATGVGGLVCKDQGSTEHERSYQLGATEGAGPESANSCAGRSVRRVTHGSTPAR
jgi:hypothetical protein